MEKDVKKLKSLIHDRNILIDSKLPHIRWNLEPSEEREMDNKKIDYFFFVNYRNPEKVLRDIEEQFRDFSLGFSFERVNDYPARLVKGTVNSWIFANYVAAQGPDKFNFSWTKLPIVRDNKLSKHYRKNWDIFEYVQSLVE